MRNILIASSAVVFIGAVGVLAFTRHWGLPSTPKETTFAIGQANTTSVSTSSASNPTASSTSVQPFQAPISIPSTSTPIAPNFQVVDMMSAISSTSTPIAPNFEGVDMSTVGSTTPCDTDPKHNLCLKSSTAVYSEGYLILGADPNTFTVLGYAGYYGKDDKHVYWLIEGEEGPEPHQVLGADAASFTVLSNYEWYAKDNSHVYWAGYLIPGADPKTFRVVDPPEQCGPRCQIEAQDRSHTYEITY